MKSPILELYAKTDISDWAGLEKFALDGMVKITGLDATYFDVLLEEEDAYKVVKVQEAIAKIRNPETSALLADYTLVHMGSRYMQSVGQPFPPFSLMTSAKPLMDAIKTGDSLTDLKRGLVKLMSGHDVFQSLIMARDDISPSDQMKNAADNIKKIVPETTAIHVLEFIAHGPLQPSMRKSAAAILDDAFGTATASLVDFKFDELRPN